MKNLIAWNISPKRTGNFIDSNKLNGLSVHNDIKNTSNNEFETISINVQYLDNKGNQFLKS